MSDIYYCDNLFIADENVMFCILFIMIHKLFVLLK